jgi:regulating synaptic membrane exocytosis protein 2
MVVGEGGQLSEFIDGLGPGQLVGRQVLGAPALGDIQLSLCYQKGFLEVEVIRARGLQVSLARNKNVNKIFHRKKF